MHCLSASKKILHLDHQPRIKAMRQAECPTQPVGIEPNTALHSGKGY